MSRLGALHITKHTGLKHTGTVIFLHGSGDSGGNVKEWVNILIKNFSFPHIKVIYPTAPLQPYTLMSGHVSNVWFDRAEISPKVPEKVASLNQIKESIIELVRNEVNDGIQMNRIVVGGFSMGGALSFHVGYHWAKDLAGVFAFSSFLNEQSAVYDELKNNPSDKLPPLLQLHGDSDGLVELEWGRQTFEALQQLGVSGDFRTLEGLGHALNKRGLMAIRDFVLKCLPET